VIEKWVQQFVPFGLARLGLIERGRWPFVLEGEYALTPRRKVLQERLKGKGRNLVDDGRENLINIVLLELQAIAELGDRELVSGSKAPCID
jgi:hypothetical protein